MKRSSTLWKNLQLFRRICDFLKDQRLLERSAPLWKHALFAHFCGISSWHLWGHNLIWSFLLYMPIFSPPLPLSCFWNPFSFFSPFFFFFYSLLSLLCQCLEPKNCVNYLPLIRTQQWNWYKDIWFLLHILNLKFFFKTFWKKRCKICFCFYYFAFHY